MKVTSCQEYLHLYPSPGLPVSAKSKPRPHPMLARQKQDRGKVRLTHSCVLHPCPFFSHPISPNINTQRKKRTAKGKGWLRSLVTRPPLTSFFIRKGKETKEEKRQGGGGRAGEEKLWYIFTSAVSSPHLHKIKATTLSSSPHSYPSSSSKCFWTQVSLKSSSLTKFMVNLSIQNCIPFFNPLWPQLGAEH